MFFILIQDEQAASQILSDNGVSHSITTPSVVGYGYELDKTHVCFMLVDSGLYEKALRLVNFYIK